MIPRHSIMLRKESFSFCNDELKKKFNKAIDFIKWQTIEKNVLANFQSVIANEIVIHPKEITRIIYNSKLDFQLGQLILKLIEEIKENISSFKDFSNEKYQSMIARTAAGKMALLIKTSPSSVKNLCDLILYIHFMSQNLDNYSKILKEFKNKNIQEKIISIESDYSFIIGYKIYTVWLLLAIKLNYPKKPSQFFEQAIYMRSRYIDWKEGKGKKKMKTSGISKSFKLFNPAFVSITFYITYEHIKSMVQQDEDKYEIMLKVYEYIRQLKEERRKGLISSQNCQIFIQNIQQLSQPIKAYIESGKEAIKELEEEIQSENQTQRGRYKSLQEKIRVRENFRSFNKQLQEKFFKKNSSDKEQNKRCKSVLGKNKGSKIQIMHELFKNNWENTRNALLKVELQMKTQKKQKIIQERDKTTQQSELQKQKVAEDESIKKTKDKRELKKKTKDRYHYFKNSKNIVCDVSMNRLEKQIYKIQDIIIWNRLDQIEEEKKCIIQFVAKHKEEISTNVTSYEKSQKIQKIQIVKIIGGISQIMGFVIKPKDKNLELQVKMCEISLKLCLPRGQNIFNGRYQTIWPTVKYHIKKKIMEYSIFKQNQVSNFWKQDSNQNGNTIKITEEKLLNMFGDISEDEFNEICLALGYISKFIDFLISRKTNILGSSLIAQEIIHERTNFCLRLKRTSSDSHFQQLKDEVRIMRNQEIFICAFLLSEEDTVFKHEKFPQKIHCFVEVFIETKSFLKFVKYKGKIQFTIKTFKQAFREGMEKRIMKKIFTMHSSHKKKKNNTAERMKIQINIKDISDWGISSFQFIQFVGSFIQRELCCKSTKQKLINFFRQKLIIQRECNMKTCIKVKTQENYFTNQTFRDPYSNNLLFIELFTKRKFLKKMGDLLAPFIVEFSDIKDTKNRYQDSIIEETPRYSIKKISKVKLNRLTSLQYSEINKCESCRSVSFDEITSPKFIRIQEEVGYQGFYSNYHLMIQSESFARQKTLSGGTYDFALNQLIFPRQKTYMLLVQVWKKNSRNKNKFYLSEDDIFFFCPHLQYNYFLKRQALLRSQKIGQQILPILSKIVIEKVKTLPKIYISLNNNLFCQRKNIFNQENITHQSSFLQKQRKSKVHFHVKVCKILTKESFFYGTLSLASCFVGKNWFWQIKLYFQRNRHELAIRIDPKELLKNMKNAGFSDDQKYEKLYLNISLMGKVPNYWQKEASFVKQFSKHINVSFNIEEKNIECSIYGKKYKMKTKLSQRYIESQKCLYIVELDRQLNKEFNLHKYDLQSIITLYKITDKEQKIDSDLIRNILDQYKLERLQKGFLGTSYQRPLVEVSQYYLDNLISMD